MCVNASVCGEVHAPKLYWYKSRKLLFNEKPPTTNMYSENNKRRMECAWESGKNAWVSLENLVTLTAASKTLAQSDIRE